MSSIGRWRVHADKPVCCHDAFICGARIFFTAPFLLLCQIVVELICFWVIPEPIFRHLSPQDRSVCHTMARLHTKSLPSHNNTFLAWLRRTRLEFIAGEWRSTALRCFLSVFPPLERTYHQSVPSGFYPGWELRPLKHFSLHWPDCFKIRYLNFHKALTVFPLCIYVQRGTFLVGEKHVQFSKCSMHGFYRSVVSISVREAKSILCPPGQTVQALLDCAL